MRPFNLAESRIAERRYCRLQLMHALKVMGALVVLTALVAMGSYGCKMGISNRATRLKTDLARVQERCLEIKQGMGTVKTRETQRKWQGQLVQGSERWLNVLSSVLSRVPAEVWLSRIESQNQNSVIAIDGSAASYEALAEFIERLRGYREITEVRLGNSRVSAVDSRSMIDFSLQAKLKSSTPAAQTGAATPAPPAQMEPAR